MAIVKHEVYFSTPKVKLNCLDMPKRKEKWQFLFLEWSTVLYLKRTFTFLTENVGVQKWELEKKQIEIGKKNMLFE